MPQDRIIYIHVAKNGGTTMHAIFDRLYKEDHIFNIIDDTDIDTKRFIELPKEKRYNIRLLKGHLYYGLHKHLQGKYDYVSFLRKPEERIISYYYYILSLPHHSLYKKMIENKTTLVEFAQQMKHKDINNAQVRMLSGIDDKGDLMLEKALENIEKRFSMIGFKEYFDESLLLLKYLYNWNVPYYKKKNVNLKKSRNISFSTIDLNVINELNKEDNVLYDFCLQRFQSQLEEIPNFNFELKRLKLYNKVYSSTKVKQIKNGLSKFSSNW